MNLTSPLLHKASWAPRPLSPLANVFGHCKRGQRSCGVESWYGLRLGKRGTSHRLVAATCHRKSTAKRTLFSGGDMFSTRVCNCTLRFFSLRHGNMEACLPVIWWRRQEINLPDHCCPNLTYSLPKGVGVAETTWHSAVGGKNHAIKSLAFPDLFIAFQPYLPRPKLQTNFQLKWLSSCQQRHVL